MTTTTQESSFDVLVTGRTYLSSDILSLELSAAPGLELPRWEPGSHIDLVLRDGLSRQYSLCGPVDDRSVYRVGVLRERSGRGGSQYIHDCVALGDRISVRGPRNHFRLVPSHRYVFAAGGIGVTPLLPMVAQAQRAGAEIVFLYCARDRASMAYLPELQAAVGDQLLLHADDESGLFDLASFFGQPQQDTEVYACGPARFLDATVEATGAWPSGSVHIERFTPLDVSADEDVAFEVELTRSGRVLHVPAEQSVLQVLTQAGVRVLSSCTEGTCGTCEVGVVGGAPVQHRDAVLDEEERTSGEVMMVCVSRCSGGRLLLDL